MKVFSLACLVASAFAFAIGFGYVYYVVVIGGNAFPIPTISRTWTFRPSNFVSRQIVIPGSVALMIIHTAIYYACKDCRGASFFLLVALVANAFLAVVSAICMDDFSAECLGSVKLHDGFAVAYFSLIDFWMVGMQLAVPRKDPKRPATLLRDMICLMTVLVNGSQLLSPSAIQPHVGFGSYQGFDISLGEFEWLNVTTILIFTISFVYEHVMKTQVGILSLNDPVAPVDKGNTKMVALLSINNGSLTIVALIMCLATMGIAYSVAVARGDFQPLPHVPEVSDLFVLPPGNSYAHFGGVLGSTILSIVTFQFSYAYQAWALSPKVPLFSSLVAVFSLSMSLCVSKIEDTDLHFFFVAGFFAWFQVFTLWITFITQTGKTVPKQSLGWMSFASLLSLLSKARFAIWGLEQFAIWELCDVVFNLVFVGSFAWFHAETLKQHPFALFDVIDTENDAKDEEEGLSGNVPNPKLLAI